MHALRQDCSWRKDALLCAIMFGIAVGYVGFFALELFQLHGWMLDARGRPVASDFLEVWVAGRTALAGNPAATYDFEAHHIAQIAAAGHRFSGYFYWNYPPLFLFPAVILARVPYLAAFLGWVIATGVAYAAAVGAIARRAAIVFAACASPAVLLNAFVGQNGFLTAALIGGALLCLDRRPVLAGVFLGLLTYKPQFGVLFPLALIAGRHWRALFSACATAFVAIAASCAAFGPATYTAFFKSLPIASRAILTNEGESWNKMQSIYAVARTLGAGDAIAWLAQGATVALCAGTVILLWRIDLPRGAKASALTAAAMLATPYLHEYDFPVLIVALAFLYRDRRFDHLEWTAVALMNLAILAFLLQLAPIGPGIVLVLVTLVFRRMAPTLAHLPVRHISEPRAAPPIGQVAKTGA